nr:MBL fold metallo-hydrolase [Halorussus limi]
MESNDRLAGICLTHAHLDHYSSLSAAHRDGIPIFTSPATASVLGDVFDVASDEYGVRASGEVTNAITPVEDWRSITSEVEIHPVPTGHIPGAVGFLVRVVDDGETYHLLATGDFTCRSAGGFTGFPPEEFIDIDALFLPAATNESFSRSLTNALGTALEHAHGGAPTLVATSGLVGVQVAYLLDALREEYDLGVPIRVVGQVAKLYERLDYDCAGIEQIPVFEDPQTCLGHGVITIAGPEIPRERSSGRLFDCLRENANACVVQLVGSGNDPVAEGRCTIHEYELVNHPTPQTLKSVHDAVDPTETVIIHRHGGAGGKFNDFDSVVWGTGDTNKHTLFDGEQWRLPPAAGGGTVVSNGERNLQQFASTELLHSFSVPSLTRHDDPDLEAEGINQAEIASLLHHGPNAATSLDAPNHSEETQATMSDTESMTADDDSTNDDAEEKATHRQTGLIDTTGVTRGDQTSMEATEQLDTSSLTPKNMVSQRAAKQLRESQSEADLDNSVNDDNGEPGTGQEIDSTAETEGAQTTGNTEAEDNEPEQEPEGESASPEQSSPVEEASQERQDPQTGEGNPTTESTVTPEGDKSAKEADTESERENGNAETTEGDSITVSLDPLAVALAEWSVTTSDQEDVQTVDDFVTEAVRQYVVALLAGEASGSEKQGFAVNLTGSPTVEQTIEDLVRNSGELDSTMDILAKGIAATLDTDIDSAVEIRNMDDHREYLDAIVRNESNTFTNHEEIVEAAINWQLCTE